MNEILQAIKNRKSVRVFTDQDIKKEDCETILQAAMQAPSAGNQQQYTILNITDVSIRQALVDICDHQPMIAKAKFVLIFLADPRRWYDAYHKAGLCVRKPLLSDLMLGFADGCIAAQNAVMAAESLGIGSCYIGDIIENAEQVQALLHLPAYVMPCAMLIFGYPTVQQKDRTKPNRFDTSYIIQENYYQNRVHHQQAFENRGCSLDYKSYLEHFASRKYESDFSKEMARSVNVYFDEFKKNKGAVTVKNSSYVKK